MVGQEVVAGDRLDALHRPLRRPAVGVAGVGLLEEALARHRARVVLLVAQPGDHLAAHALDRVRVEARLGERQPKQLEGLVRVPDQRLQRAAERVRADGEVELDGSGGQALLEGVGGIRAGALVEKARQHLGDAGLAVRVLRRAALEREGERDERHDRALDMPRLHPAGREHRAGLRRGSGTARGERGRHRGVFQDVGVAASALARWPVTDRRGTRKRSATLASSSRVTASMAAGQRRTDSIGSPIASAEP